MKALSKSPYKYVQKTEKKYPEVWKQVAIFRRERGVSLPDWPEWCYLPLAAGYAITSGGGDNRVGFSDITDVSMIPGLAAWRSTRGVYKFDNALFGKLWSRSIDDIPLDTVFNLPEKCIYIEVPKYFCDDFGVVGLFVFLEFDIEEGHPELRYLFDFGNELVPFFTHIEEDDSLTIDMVEKFLSVILYLCSENADIAQPTVNKINKNQDSIKKVGFSRDANEVRCA